MIIRIYWINKNNDSLIEVNQFSIENKWKLIDIRFSFKINGIIKQKAVKILLERK